MILDACLLKSEYICSVESIVLLLQHSTMIFIAFHPVHSHVHRMHWQINGLFNDKFSNIYSKISSRKNKIFLHWCRSYRSWHS